MPGIEQLGHGPLGDARIVDLRVPKLSGFVHLLSGETNVGGRCGSIPVRKTFRAASRDLAALLRRVVLVGEAALGRRLDLKRYR